MAEAARNEHLGFATTERQAHPSGTRLAERPSSPPPATVRMGGGVAVTQPMPAATSAIPLRGAPPGFAGSATTSPVASSVQMPGTWCADLVVFPGEKLARVDDFVRLRLQARSITFLGTLMREGITPEYYAAMSERFAEACRADRSLEARYRARLEKAARRR